MIKTGITIVHTNILLIKEITIQDDTILQETMRKVASRQEEMMIWEENMMIHHEDMMSHQENMMSRQDDMMNREKGTMTHLLEDMIQQVQGTLILHENNLLMIGIY